MVTVFPVQSLDRRTVKWEDELYRMTPVEQGASGMRYKREDYFAPLGYGGINGSKLRNCIFLLDKYARKSPGIISAGSVKSPQHAMVATVAKHYGLKSFHVLGATTADTCFKHDSVRIAQLAGAEFDFISVAYNPVLQKRVRDLQNKIAFADYYPLEYAISLDHHRYPPGDIAEFHSVGAIQTQNLPRDMRRLIVPAGSCVTSTSVLYGVITGDFDQLREVHLIGIGHYRMDWLGERLTALGVALDEDITTVGKWRLSTLIGTRAVNVYYHDLVGAGFTDYQQMWDEELDGIIGHPTYEAKCFRWLKERFPQLIDPDSVFWIVGSEPKAAIMERALRGL